MKKLFFLIPLIGFFSAQKVHAQNQHHEAPPEIMLDSRASSNTLVDRVSDAAHNEQVQINFSLSSENYTLQLEKGLSVSPDMDLSTFTGICKETGLRAGCIVMDKELSIFIETEDGTTEYTTKKPEMDQVKLEQSGSFYVRYTKHGTNEASEFVSDIALDVTSESLTACSGPCTTACLAEHEAQNKSPMPHNNPDILPSNSGTQSMNSSPNSSFFDLSHTYSALGNNIQVGQKYITIYLWEFYDSKNFYIQNIGSMIYYSELSLKDVTKEYKIVWRRPLKAFQTWGFNVYYLYKDKLGLTSKEFNQFLKSNIPNTQSARRQNVAFKNSIEKYFKKYGLTQSHIYHGYLSRVKGWKDAGGGQAYSIGSNYFVCRDNAIIFVHELGHCFGAFHSRSSTDVMFDIPSSLSSRYHKHKDAANRSNIIRWLAGNSWWGGGHGKVMPKCGKLQVNSETNSKLKPTQEFGINWQWPSGVKINPKAFDFLKITGASDLTYSVTMASPSAHFSPRTYILNEKFELLKQIGTSNVKKKWNYGLVDLDPTKEYYIVVTGGNSNSIRLPSYRLSAKGKSLSNTSCPTKFNPSQQGFEWFPNHRPLSDWSNGNAMMDETDWNIRQGSTPSHYTGPSSGSWASKTYAFLEASWPRIPGDKAVLYSDCFYVGDNNWEYGFCFYYHMHADWIFYSDYGDMGDLHVEVSADGNHWKTIKVLEGRQGSSWKMAKFYPKDVLPNNTKHMRVRITAVRGNTFTSDIAIDDLYFYKHKPSAPPLMSDRKKGVYANLIGDTPSPLVYPNPANDEIQIDFRNLSGVPANLAIISSTGVTVSSVSLSGNTSNERIPLEGLSPGIYTIQYSLAGQNHSYRFIKN